MSNPFPRTVYHTKCRICKSPNLQPVLSLGVQYVSDFVDKDKVHSGIRCPIQLVRCRDCTLVQQSYTAEQEFLYKRHYWYRSGVTQTMRNQLKDVAEYATRTANLKSGDVVLDIGSNDGTLLRSYPYDMLRYNSSEGIIKIGVEPAKNLQEEGREGINYLIPAFWDVQSVEKIEPDVRLSGYAITLNGHHPLCIHQKPKVVTAIGMAYDLEDPNRFIADVAKVLHPEGIFIMQLMCLKQMIELGDIGNLAHEHLEFYTLESIHRLLMNYRLQVVDIEENKVNGGSYRIAARPLSYDLSTIEEHSRYDRCKSFSIAEQHYISQEGISYFNDRMKASKEFVRDFIYRAREHGSKIWVYGASTKGNVLLQYYGLDSAVIEAAADRSPEKHGKYTIGTGIPIKSEDEFRKANPEYALVLPYAFLPEFMEREKEWRDKGGRFIVPLPNPAIV